MSRANMAMMLGELSVNVNVEQKPDRTTFRCLRCKCDVLTVHKEEPSTPSSVMRTLAAHEIRCHEGKPT